jgi:hypothetical protein
MEMTMPRKHKGILATVKRIKLRDDVFGADIAPGERPKRKNPAKTGTSLDAFVQRFCSIGHEKSALLQSRQGGTFGDSFED